MSGFDPKDRLPMAAAVIVVVCANIVGYLLDVTIYMSILAAPLAIGAFIGVRYALHGDALPDAVTGES